MYISIKAFEAFADMTLQTLNERNAPQRVLRKASGAYSGIERVGGKAVGEESGEAGRETRLGEQAEAQLATADGLVAARRRP